MSEDSMIKALQAARELSFPRPGDLVTGKVIDLAKNYCLLELVGGVAVGIIKGKEIVDSIGSFKKIKMGDEIQAAVVEDENEEGFLVLSIRKASQNTAWDRFMKMEKDGEVFEVKCDEANKGGLLLSIDSIKAFIPVSQLAPMHYPRVNDANSAEILRRLQKLIGDKFRVKIIALDRENGKLILSERAAEQGSRNQNLDNLQVGQVMKGKISGIVKFGIFVAFEGLEGLVHISEIAWGHVRNPADYGKMGDEVEVMVIGIEGEKISLSMKRLQKDPWVEAASKFKIGEKVKGKVNRITTFGAFVTLSKDINGLIHLSEISNQKVEDIEKFLGVGQELETVIINVDMDEHRIGLSLKALEKTPESAEAASGTTATEVATTEVETTDIAEEVPAPVDDISDIPGVTKKVAVALTKAGYDRKKLATATVAELTALEGIGEKTAKKIVAGVKSS